MSSEGQYGDDYTLKAAGKCFDCNIMVLREDQQPMPEDENMVYTRDHGPMGKMAYSQRRRDMETRIWTTRMS